MAKPFEVPWTISDDNQFGVPFLPWYFTYQEAGIAFMSLIVFYCLWAPLLGTGLVNFGAMVVSGLVFISVMNSYKNDKPASWLWDLRLALGFLPQSRGILKSSQAIRWLSGHHVPRPSVFLAGKTRAGHDLTASNPVLTLLPPAIAFRPLVVPHRRRRPVEKPSRAPAWFRYANHCENLVNPHLPITVTTVYADVGVDA